MKVFQRLLYPQDIFIFLFFLFLLFILSKPCSLEKSLVRENMKQKMVQCLDWQGSVYNKGSSTAFCILQEHQKHTCLIKISGFIWFSLVGCIHWVFYIYVSTYGCWIFKYKKGVYNAATCSPRVSAFRGAVFTNGRHSLYCWMLDHWFLLLYRKPCSINWLSNP